MEFRLLYSGNELVSTGSPKDKHVIRRTFHPQLKQLWKSNSQLRKLAIDRGGYDLQPGTDPFGKEYDEQATAAYFNRVGNLYERGKHRFIPLVEQNLCLRVSIDILFLRPDQHPLIKDGGDIDNRLKTLFDAFRVPETADGLGGKTVKDEDPLFVFLQDDSLISEIRVNTDNLLRLPQTRDLSAADVFMVINVKLKPTERTAHNWAFD